MKTEIEARTARQMATRDAVGSSKEKRKRIYDPTDVEKIVKAYEDGDEVRSSSVSQIPSLQLVSDDLTFSVRPGDGRVEHGMRRL